MNLLLVYVTVALLGGAVALWREPRLPRAWPLLAVAAVPQLLSMAGIRGLFLFTVTALALTCWCWHNWSLPGAVVVAAGLALNLLVMGLHGGAMPIHSESLSALGYPVASGTVLIGSKDLVVDNAMLGWLGDWIVIDWLPVRLVASPGDIVVLAGIVWWLLAGKPRQQQTVAMA